MESTLKLVIESERLLLVPIADEHAEANFREFTAEITEFMFPGPPDSIEEVLVYIHEARARMQRGEEFSATLFLRATDEFLGGCSLHHLDGETPELAIWIKEGAHGHGYGREAVTALARWAFENLKVRYLIYPVDRRNIPSRRIPELLDGVIEAEYEQENMSGRVLQMLEYRIYPRLPNASAPFHPNLEGRSASRGSPSP